MNYDTKYTISRNIMARSVGNETVILDLESGTYFGLDAVGGRIFQLFSAGSSLGQVFDVILTEYDVSREVLEQDVIDFVRELSEKKLISSL